jgi:IclR family transcriptional regulator, KDG regulon repressor
MVERYMVPAIRRAFQIIELLATQDSTMSISDIRSTLHLPLSSTANIMYTLTDLGYMERDESDSSYRLSVKLLGIAVQAQNRLDLVSQGYGLLKDVVRETGLTGHLSVLRDGQSMYIARVSSNSLVQINSYVGQRWPAYTSAAGKALLAFLPEAQLQRLLKQMVYQKRTPYTLASRSALLKQLRTFRHLGYTWERSEGEVGLGCVAAPIVGPGNELLAAISLTGTIHQISQKKVPILGGVVKKYAEQISRRLGAGADTG